MATSPDPFATVREALRSVPHPMDDALTALASIEERLAELEARPIARRIDDLRRAEAAERERDALQHIIDCADTPLMRDVLAERAAASTLAGEFSVRALKAEEQLEALRQTLDLFVNQPELVERDDYTRARKEFFGSSDGRVVAYPASEPDEFPITWLRCANCERATTTGLCGCPNPAPQKIGEGVMRVSNQESKP